MNDMYIFGALYFFAKSLSEFESKHLFAGIFSLLFAAAFFFVAVGAIKSNFAPGP